MAWYKHPTNQVINTNNSGTGLGQVYTAWQTWETDPTVHWQIASYNSVAPAYLVLKRKNGSAGRLMFVSGSSIASNYLAPNETAVTTYLYMGYDPGATTDAPAYANYSVNGSALFASNQFSRFRSFGAYWGSYSFRLYVNPEEDQLCMFGSGGSAQGMMVGNLFKNDAGSVVPGIITFHAASSPNPMTLSNVAYTSSINNNLAGNCVSLVWDATANEGTTSVWHCLSQYNMAGQAPGGYTATYNHYARPNGVHKFVPIIMSVNTNPTARPSSVVYSTRNVAYGPPMVVDHVWVNNLGATKGYYLGQSATPSTDTCMISLVSDTF
jgi:hypothetical protein